MNRILAALAPLVASVGAAAAQPTFTKAFIPDTIGKDAPEGIRCRAAIHWVDAASAVNAEIRLYDRLFSVAAPDADKDRPFTEFLNPESMLVLSGCKLESGLAQAEAGSHWQFERQGYFCVDTKDSAPGRPVFNRAVTLRDTWAKIARK